MTSPFGQPEPPGQFSPPGQSPPPQYPPAGQYPSDPYSGGGYQQYGQPQPYGQYPGYGPATPYGQPGPYPMYPPGAGPTNGLAVASLVLGIAQILLWLLTGIPAIILGLIALKQISARGESGKGMAITGLVLGCIGVGLSIIFIVFLIIGLHSAQANCSTNASC
jgi:Domain of unknown function (DUF4190)